MQDKINLTWYNVDSVIRELLLKIKTSKIEFDTILGVGRGGLIPATILSYKLKINNLQNIGINTRHGDDTTLYQKPKLSGNVLVVDDINDTGKTFDIVKTYIDEEYKVNSIKYASLILRSTSTFKENIYFGNEENTDKWYVFPWDK